jgi:hypothetical protein
MLSPPAKPLKKRHQLILTAYVFVGSTEDSDVFSLTKEKRLQKVIYRGKKPITDRGQDTAWPAARTK